MATKTPATGSKRKGGLASKGETPKKPRLDSKLSRPSRLNDSDGESLQSSSDSKDGGANLHTSPPRRGNRGSKAAAAAAVTGGKPAAKGSAAERGNYQGSPDRLVPVLRHFLLVLRPILKGNPRKTKTASAGTQGGKAPSG